MAEFNFIGTMNLLILILITILLIITNQFEGVFNTALFSLLIFIYINVCEVSPIQESKNGS